MSAIAASVAALPAVAGAQECPALSVINCGHRGTGTNGGGNAFPEKTLAAVVLVALARRRRG